MSIASTGLRGLDRALEHVQQGLCRTLEGATTTRDLEEVDEALSFSEVVAEEADYVSAYFDDTGSVGDSITDIVASIMNFAVPDEVVPNLPQGHLGYMSLSTAAMVRKELQPLADLERGINEMRKAIPKPGTTMADMETRWLDLTKMMERARG